MKTKCTGLHCAIKVRLSACPPGAFELQEHFLWVSAWATVACFILIDSVRSRDVSPVEHNASEGQKGKWEQSQKKGKGKEKKTDKQGNM